MSQTVQTQFGTGTVVDRENVRGRVSYKVEGPGFSTWVEATAMPLDFQWMPGPDDIQDNSTVLPYNPSPQTWVNPKDQNIVPGRQGIDPRKRTAPADSVDLQEEGESYEPGPDPKLFATGGLSPEDIQAKLGPKYVNAFVEHDFTSLQARLEEHPEIVMAEARERVAELVAQADQQYLSRVGRNEYLEASDPQLREAAWADVRAKAVRLRKSGQINTRGATPDIIMAQVTGDHGTYEVIVRRSNIFQGNSSVDEWSCECPWGQWAFKREHKFVGRLCSHAYATLMELQSMTRSNKPNPKFRNQPAIFSSLTASEADSVEAIVDFLLFCDKERLSEESHDSLDFYNGDDELSQDDYNTIYDFISGDLDDYIYTKVNERVRQRSGSRTAESLETVIDYARDNVYDTLAENGLDIHDPEAYDLIQETWRSSLGMYEDMYGLEIPEEVYNRYASRTAEMVDIRPVGWDPYARNLMNRLRDLWEEGSRPGQQKKRNEEVRDLVQELRDRGYATDGIVASFRESFIDRPLGYGDIPDYGFSEDYILEHELQHREDVTEPEFEYSAGGDHGVVNDLNDGMRSARQVTASGWTFDPNNGSIRFDDGTVRVSIGAGSSFSNSDHLAEGQWGAFVQSGASNQMVGNGRAGTVEEAYAAASAAVQSEGASLPPIDVDYHRITSALSLPKGTRVQRLNLDGSPSGQTGVVSRDHQGLTEWDQVTVLWDGDDKPSLNDLTEVQWGEYEDGTPTKELDDTWNIHGANDDYVYGEPPAYDSGDEYGGDENPYYVDPAEQTDWDDPLPESEDDIVANFQRNAGHLLGGGGGGSGGNDDIAAAAEAHLRTAGRNFTMAEQQALIDEDDGLPYDRSQLDLRGTHYL